MVDSAGLLIYRKPPIEVLIAHPGGPLWRNRNEGAWSIPKGVVEPGETRLQAARREFGEETGLFLEPDCVFVDLGTIQLKSGKVVSAWAVEANLDTASAKFGEFEMEWPPKSGLTKAFPEIDELRWVNPTEAARLLNPAQVRLVDRLVTQVGW